jgi:hypothetical protein
MSMQPNEASGLPREKTDTDTQDNPLHNIPIEEPIKSRTVGVMFLNQDNRPVTILEVQVFPQPFTVDRNFRFYSAENDFLKKNIRIVGRYNARNIASTTHKYIHCTSSKVTIIPPKVPVTMHYQLDTLSVPRVA